MLMKYQTYIYGRTFRIDFRDICIPQTALSNNVKNLVSQLINTDIIANGSISCIRYLFIRDTDYVLFGIGFNHAIHLPQRYHTDDSRIRELRSFVGIIIDSSEFEGLKSIPISQDFFINLYLEKIKDIWDLEDRPINRKPILSDYVSIDPQTNWIELIGNFNFNESLNCCRFFPQSKLDEVLSSIKRCKSSFATGLNNEGHVVSSFCRYGVVFPNALCLETSSDHLMTLQANRDFSRTETGITKKIKLEKKNYINFRIRRKEQEYDLKEDASVEHTIVDYFNSIQEPAIVSDLKHTHVLSPNHGNNQASKDTMFFEWGDNKTTSADAPLEERKTEPQISLQDVIPDSNSKGSQNNDVSSINLAKKDDSSKKVFRLKLFVILLIVLVLILVLISHFSRPAS